MKRFLALFICLILLGQTWVLPASAQESAPFARVQQTLDDILACNVHAAGASSIQHWIDTALAADAGIGAEWYVLGLEQIGGYDFSAYQAALRAYLDGSTIRSATTRQKYALALLASGADDPYIAEVMEDSIGQQGVMSWVYGLHLMTNGCESSTATVDSAIDMLLSLQLPDGGWALRGDVSDVDVTAMTLQALAPYTDREAVAAAADAALALLSQRQMEDGGFASYGAPNPESAAQVLTALSALDVDAFADDRFIKNGATLFDAMLLYQLPDGSFSHTLGGVFSTTATAQVFYALVAYQRFLAGQPPLYVLDRLAEPQSSVPAKAELSYQAVACILIAALMLIGCLVLFVMGKRHRKNFAAVIIIALLSAAFVLTTDFQTADNYYTTAIVTKGNAIGSVTMSIRCDPVAGQADYIPADGVILPETTFPIAQGDTVYTILTEAARAYSIPMENTGGKGMAYIAGIGHLYEYAFGDLSGWVYHVDGESPSVGCDQYTLRDGQKIEWMYTLELGNDLKSY